MMTATRRASDNEARRLFVKLRVAIPRPDGTEARVTKLKWRCLVQELRNLYFGLVKRVPPLFTYLVNKSVDRTLKRATEGKKLWGDEDEVSTSEDDLAFGRAVWSVMSNNRLWKSRDGKVYGLGGFREAAGLVADVFGGVYPQYAWEGKAWGGDAELYSDAVEGALLGWGFEEVEDDIK